MAVGRQRVQAARLLLEHGADVIVADDGLQHLALARDFELAVVDGDRGFGNGFCCPPGRCVSAGAAGAAWMPVLIVNGADGGWRGAERRWRRQHFYDAARGRSPAAARWRRAQNCRSRVSPAGGCTRSPASAIRERFFAQLRAAGLELREHPFPDHHRYRAVASWISVMRCRC